MGLQRRIMTRAGLQLKMTVYVTAAVLAVSAIVLTLLVSRVRRDYEKIADARINDALTAISRIMEQRLIRIEGMTKAMASVASTTTKCPELIDSLLFHNLESMDNILGVSLILEKGYVPGVPGYFEHYAYLDENKNVRIDSYDNNAGIETDNDWVKCYKEGQSFWGEMTEEINNGRSVLCYFVPLYNSAGSRVGIAYSVLQESYITSFVTEYKIRKDLDISIFKENGTMVVAPDDYILDLAPEDLITRRRTIDHLGWTIVLSADRKILEKAVWKALVSMALLILLMFIVTTLAIILTVKFVATPFVRKQQEVEKEKAVMDSEMALASSAQNELIPHVFPPFPERKEIELSACLYPAREVGGDLYDYFLNDGKLYFCIGDVAGKGVQASLFMAATHYLFRNVAAGVPASEAVNKINRSLSADNERCRFVTFWFGCLDLGNGSLEYVNAGHSAPVLIHGGRAEFFFDSDNPPLGVLDEMDFVQKSTVLQPSDILLLYTDGVTEAMDSNSNEFGNERFLEAANAVSGTGTMDFVDGVLAKVREHAEGTYQSDDITMLCVKYNGN